MESDSQTVDSRVAIEKLHGSEQWTNWRFKIKLALYSSDVMDVVDGSMTRTAHNEIEFLKLDRKAQAIIGTTIGSSQIKHVKHCNTAKDMWDELHSIYDRKNEIMIAKLQAQFWNFKIDDSESIIDATARLTDIVNMLDDAGHLITDATKVTRMIDALPDKYSVFRPAWDSTLKGQRMQGHNQDK